MGQHTSLFSVFQNELQPSDDEWVDIYFDYKAEENVQESLFVALEREEVDPQRHFPINVLFDSVKYRESTDSLEREIVKKIDLLQERFKEFMLPYEIFESENRNNVAIVFSRINRAGTELNIFQLLSAWSWSEDFDLSVKFEELQAEIIEHEYDDLCKDTELQLRICAGVIKGETTPSAILALQGEQIRTSFKKIRNGIIGAVDFLKRELNVTCYKLLPFPGILVPLSAFFATESIEGLGYTDRQKDKIFKWFWRSLFSRRFAAGVNDKQAHDISQMLALKKDENYSFEFPPKEIKFNLKENVFSVSSANSKTFILLLSQFSPFSFLSGAKIDLAKVLQKINRNEFHHIFPIKHLMRTGKTKKEINVLANICFLTRGDNNKILDKSPAEYEKMITGGKKSLYLENALCPLNFHELEYNQFLTEREKIIKEKIKNFIA